MYASASLMRKLTGMAFPATVLPIINATEAPLQGRQVTFLTTDGTANAKDREGTLGVTAALASSPASAHWGGRVHTIWGWRWRRVWVCG
jgi:hypothetical protein